MDLLVCSELRQYARRLVGYYNLLIYIFLKHLKNFLCTVFVAGAIQEWLFF